MATIVKRGKKYAVVYYYTDEDGKQQQKWEPPVNTKKEALKRKNEIEHAMDTGTFVLPTRVVMKDFMHDFVEMYGTKKWGLSAYAANTGLIRNYIDPILGDKLVQEISPRVVDLYVHQLQRTKPVSLPYRKAKTEFLPPATIEKVFKLLRTAFKIAIRWGLVGKNPFEGAILPETEKKKRDIWDVVTIRKALDACEDGKLYVALNLAFACSLRIGEITGLTWDCLDISDKAIANDMAFLRVEKELVRVNQEAIEKIGPKGIIFTFPKVMGGKAKSRLVLKTPKTESSIRTVWIPRTLALILREWQEKQRSLKELMGEDFIDYNLVLALETGRPCEERVIGNAFNRLKQKTGLPNVVFHSLRHSSTTYKLKVNHGDIKATQGDTGHAQPDMVTEVYAHILDEDRKINAQRFELAFYANPDLRKTEEDIRKGRPSAQAIDLGSLITQLREQPELAATLVQLLKGVAPQETNTGFRIAY